MHYSLTLSLIINLWRYIVNCYDNSILKKIIDKSSQWFSFFAKNSVIYNFISNNKSVIKTSIIYKVYSSIIDAIMGFFVFFRKIVRDSKDGSLFCKLLTLFSNMAIYIGKILEGSYLIYLIKTVFLPDEDNEHSQNLSLINFCILIAIFILPFVPKMASLLFIIFVVTVFLLRQFWNEDYCLRKSFIDIPILCLAVIMIITTITSYNVEGSFRDLVINISAIGFLFVMVNSVKNKNQLNTILTTLVFTGVLVALYGLYQYKVGVKIDDAWVDVANNPGLRTRVFSVFGNPNILAEYLIMIIPISLSLFWVTKNLFKKGIFLLTTLILTGTLILTFSRGGWLGFAFGILVFVLLVEKRLLLSLIPAGLISIFIMPSSILHRINTITNLRDSSNAYRIKVWDITLDIIKDNWMSGVGFGYIPFRQTFVKYIRTMNVYHAHNMYLETFAEMGIGGFLILLIMIFVIYKYSIINYKKVQNRYLKIITAGTLASLSSILFHGLVENVLYLPRIIITFWTIISLILIMLNISKDNKILAGE